MTKSLVPVAKIIINDKPLSVDVKSKIGSISIEVLEDLEAAAMFTLQIGSSDSIKNETYWIDNNDPFELGRKVEIKLGYKNNQESLIIGEITGFEIDFTSNGAILTVRGHSATHRLLRGNKSRTFTEMKFSDIVKKIAKEHGLKTKIEDKDLKNLVSEYVIQWNQSDFDFLKNHAMKIDHEVFIEKNTLHLRPIQRDSSKPTILILDREENLTQFSIHLSTMGQVEKIQVYSWDPKKKERLIAEVGKETTHEKNGAVLESGRKIFKNSNYATIMPEIDDQKLLDAFAKTLLDAMDRSYITGEGTCRGDPKLRVGQTIEVTGVGTRFSGYYYVTRTTHSYSESEGYKTEFSFTRKVK